MKISLALRKFHSWVSILIALPLIIVLISGLLLQFKKQVAWVQPKTQNGQIGAPTLSFPGILKAVKNAPQGEVRGWSDIDSLEVRPGKGIIKVRTKSHWEIQIDQVSGEVKQVAYRRSDLIESIHDGSYFHSMAKLGLFFPAALGLLLLWGTGLYLFILPMWVRRRRLKAP
jgi:uncharacterized iron-regulated membrane protein